MVAQSIDQLKQDWTDKYVVVDGARPELARFRDVVGQVKTVNMSGRALVEFADYHLNIGWFDIDLDFLKVVDKPAPKAEKAEGKKAAKPAAKPAPAGESASATVANPKPTPAKPATGKPSVADILAAARAGKAPAKTEGGETASSAPAAPKPAAKPAAKPPAGKVDRSKMSVADMIAAAKAGGAAGAAPAAKAPPTSPVEEPPAEESPAEAEVVASTPSAKGAPKPATASSEKLDKSKMTIDQMVAWCRDHDTK
jgi:hypothetical protein